MGFFGYNFNYCIICKVERFNRYCLFVFLFRRCFGYILSFYIYFINIYVFLCIENVNFCVLYWFDICFLIFYIGIFNIRNF